MSRGLASGQPLAAATKHPARSMVAALPVESKDPFQRGRRIDDMVEAELRHYARQIGIAPRDVTGLGIDRLRMNCKAHLFQMAEDL